MRTENDYKRLREELSQTIKEFDPIGLIALGSPSDEYEPEVGTILPRLKEARNARDMTHILYEEFDRWFGGSTTGPETAYEPLGEAVWALANKYMSE